MARALPRALPRHADPDRARDRRGGGRARGGALLAPGIEPAPGERRTRLDAGALERLARAAREAAEPADALARYALGRELGRGAVGVVYEARDLELDRLVALKLLSRTAELSPGARARFLHEARAAARLSHPFIAAVYDANEAFIAMQLVDGHDLAKSPARDPRLAATLLRDAALAVHYAHSQGVVHRDLKPANLMATSDPTPRVYVMDFGLAKETEIDAKLSRSGTIVGTPSYMAPEQARGGGAIDARTDVYGLGATLYDQLAGRPPFRGESIVETLRQVIEDEPLPLRALVPGTDRDLATIVATCLAKGPERRYASALALAGDLDRWLSGEVILARPASLAYRARRFVAKRQGALVAAGAAAGLSVLLVAPFWLQARERRAVAEDALVLAETVDLALDQARALRGGKLPRGAAAVLEQATKAVLDFSARADVGRARLFLGRLLAAQGRMQEADLAFDRALALDPALEEARFERGLARGVLVREGMRVGEPPSPEIERLRAAAIADLSAQPAADLLLPGTERAWGRGLLAWLRGETAAAERICEEVVFLDPTHVQARLVLVKIAFERGDPDLALKLAAEAAHVLSGKGGVYRDLQQESSVAIQPGWAQLPGRRELIYDLRKAASRSPTETFANGALAQEGLEAAAKALADGDAASALRELEVAQSHLTRALKVANPEPAILAASGVCALLREEALSALSLRDESAEAREAAARDLAEASRLDAGEVRVAAWWNQGLLLDRQARLALAAGDGSAGQAARDKAEEARSRARAAAPPGSDLASLLVEGTPDR
ncbi:MAG: serine/threonine protein kinase [Planctomycetes bacterium]|nr:serine/threonine protein kinase [Planctomycetota bacterium]